MQILEGGFWRKILERRHCLLEHEVGTAEFVRDETQERMIVMLGLGTLGLLNGSARVT